MRDDESTNERTDRGASAVEYGLLIAGIAAVIVVALFAFGDNLNSIMFEKTCENLVDHTGKGSCN